jgi:hypothetical protein
METMSIQEKWETDSSIIEIDEQNQKKSDTDNIQKHTENVQEKK